MAVKILQEQPSGCDKVTECSNFKEVCNLRFEDGSIKSVHMDGAFWEELCTELENKPNIVIEMEDGFVTGVSCDKVNKLGQVMVLDVGEVAPDHDYIPVTAGSMTGYGFLIDVIQKSDVGVLIRNLMETTSSDEI